VKRLKQWGEKRRQSRQGKYHQLFIEKLPELAAIDRSGDARMSRSLADQQAQNSRAFIGSFAIALAGALIIAFSGWMFDGFRASGWFVDNLWIVGMGILYTAEVGTIFVLWPRQRYWRLVTKWLALLQEAGGNAERWNDPNFRGELNQSIEAISKDLESIWQQLKPGDAQTQKGLRELASSAANSFRELKLWVSSPNALTYTDFLHRLSADFATVVEGRWYDLPRSVPATDSKRRRVPKTIYVMGAVVSIGATVFLGGQDNGAAKLASPFTGTAGVLLLNAAGLSMTAVSQAADTFKKAK